MATLVFDCETYKDYFLVAFRNIESGHTAHFQKH